jgi:hypothetical protein
MPSPLVDTLRERVDARSVVTTVAVFVALAWLLDGSPVQLAGSLLAAALVGGADLVADAYGLRDAVRRLGLGAWTLIGGSILGVVEGGLLVPVAFGVVGAWFVLDGAQSLRHNGLRPETPDGHEVYRDYLARRVSDLLADGPRTRRELHDAFDADPADVDAAVTHLRERGVVERAGSAYRKRSRSDSRLDRLRSRVGGALRRLARPVLIEFENEGDTGDRPDRAQSAPDADGDASDPDDEARDRRTERTLDAERS